MIFVTVEVHVCVKLIYIYMSHKLINLQRTQSLGIGKVFSFLKNLNSSRAKKKFTWDTDIRRCHGNS